MVRETSHETLFALGVGDLQLEIEVRVDLFQQYLDLALTDKDKGLRLCETVEIVSIKISIVRK